jgi:hypothetical protein
VASEALFPVPGYRVLALRSADGRTAKTARRLPMNHMYQAATGVALVASPECKTAVERANGVLAVALWMARG